jgi:hypothetical protein
LTGECSKPEGIAQLVLPKDGIPLPLPRYRRLISISFLLLLGFVGGCEDVSQEPSTPPGNPSLKLTSIFDPATAGTIHGKVTWKGELPVVAPVRVYAIPGAGEPFKKRQIQANPNAPRIDPTTGGVGNAVVFLRGIDTGNSKGWDQAPVRVEQSGGQFHILQGGIDSSYGFVRRGDLIGMVSGDSFLHALHAARAEFFTLMFPQPNQPLSRPLKGKGLVELTSAAGCYWMRAYLFVDDHPYYARTNSEGRFTLTQVPPGRYDLVCWIPNWNEARHERDPETGVVTRIFFAPPLELVEKVRLDSKEVIEIGFRVSVKDFKP